MERRKPAAARLQQFGGAMVELEQMAWHCGSEPATVTCHEKSVPGFVEHEIARLYGSLYSSIPMLCAYDSLRQPVNTCLIHHSGRLIAIFLVRIRAGVMNVLNEGIPLTDEQLKLFSEYAFTRHPDVDVIRFPSVHLQGSIAIARPHQHYRCAENIVISLPDSVPVYHASLGKNTRRNLKRYGDRLVRDFPSYVFEVRDGGDVDEQDVRAIIRLNVARMASKRKVSAYDQAETDRLVRLVRQCGLVGIARISGRVCAGALSFRSGDNFALSVLAHDMAYNDYSLGLLCAYHIICECIDRGAKEFHFLWGRYDYKFQLLGKERPLESLSIYRSGFKRISHAELYARNQVDAWGKRMAERLHVMGKKKSAPARLALHVLMALRSAKHAISGEPR
jgi:hypothetical protein